MNNTHKKENNDMKIKFSGNGGSLSFHYNDAKKFTDDLKRRVLPFIDDPSQKKLDKWITHTEVKEQIEKNTLPN